MLYVTGLTEGWVKVRDRIDIIADLLLGAAYADRRFRDVERQAVGALLCDLLLTHALPEDLARRIDAFDPARFDLVAAAQDFVQDPPMKKRRLLELVAHLCQADGEFDFEEDAYIRRLAEALAMAPDEYADLVLEYEIEELRPRLEDVRMTPVEGVRRPRIRVAPPTPPNGTTR